MTAAARGKRGVQPMFVVLVTKISPVLSCAPCLGLSMRRTVPSTRPAEPGCPVMRPSASGVRGTGPEASKRSIRRSGSADHWMGSNRPLIQDGRGGSARYRSCVFRRAGMNAVTDVSPERRSAISSMVRKKMSSPTPDNSPARSRSVRIRPTVRVSSERVSSRTALVWTS